MCGSVALESSIKVNVGMENVSFTCDSSACVRASLCRANQWMRYHRNTRREQWVPGTSLYLFPMNGGLVPIPNLAKGSQLESTGDSWLLVPNCIHSLET